MERNAKTSLRDEIAPMIDNAISSRKLSNSEVAKAYDCSRQHIAQVRSRGTTNRSTLGKLATAIGCPISELYPQRHNGKLS